MVAPLPTYPKTLYECILHLIHLVFTTLLVFNIVIILSKRLFTALYVWSDQRLSTLLLFIQPLHVTASLILLSLVLFRKKIRDIYRMAPSSSDIIYISVALPGLFSIPLASLYYGAQNDILSQDSLFNHTKSLLSRVYFCLSVIFVLLVVQVNYEPLNQLFSKTSFYQEVSPQHVQLPVLIILYFLQIVILLLNYADRRSFSMAALIVSTIFVWMTTFDSLQLSAAKMTDTYPLERLVIRRWISCLPYFDDRDIDLSYLLSPTVPTTFLGDSNKLKNIILRLVSNALKATYQGEVIIKVYLSPVASTKGECNVCFSVIDSGCGIEPDLLPSLFEPFSFSQSGYESSNGSTFTLTVPLTLHNVTQSTSLGSVIEMHLEPLGYSISKSTSISAGMATFKSTRDYSIIFIDATIKKEQLVSITQALTVSTAGNTYMSTSHTGISQTITPILSTQLPTKSSSTPSTPITKQQNFAKYNNGSSNLSASVLSSTSHSSNTNINILLVEDSPVNAKIATTVLQKHSFKVELQTNGQLALDKVKSSHAHFHLILMDIHMPVMDGITCARMIRKFEGENSLKPLPIIALTADTSAGHKNVCLEAGCNEFMSKPLDYPLLISLLKKLLDSTVPIAISSSSSSSSISSSSSPDESPSDGHHRVAQV
eukprot:gene21226-25499_t